MLLLAQSYAQIGAINKLSGVVAKSASINLRKLFLSPTGSIKPWFHTEGNLPLCSSYLPLGVPNWVAKHCQSSIFLAPLPGRKRISARGVSHFQSFTFLLFCLLSLLYFFLHLFIENTKKLVPFIVGISLLLLLVHYVVP
jgi:hypothetical protein